MFSIVPRFEDTVTLRGNVANPGRYPWKPGMRIRDLIPDAQALLTRRYWRNRAAIVNGSATEYPIPGPATQNARNNQAQANSATTPIGSTPGVTAPSGTTAPGTQESTQNNNVSECSASRNGRWLYERHEFALRAERVEPVRQPDAGTPPVNSNTTNQQSLQMSTTAPTPTWLKTLLRMCGAMLPKLIGITQLFSG